MRLKQLRKESGKKAQYRYEINGIKRARNFLIATLAELKQHALSIDQILLLRQCAYFKRQTLALIALKLMHCYGTVSDEYGFNPRQDRAQILKGLTMLMHEIHAQEKREKVHADEGFKVLTPH